MTTSFSQFLSPKTLKSFLTPVFLTSSMSRNLFGSTLKVFLEFFCFSLIPTGLVVTTVTLQQGYCRGLLTGFPASVLHTVEMANSEQSRRTCARNSLWLPISWSKSQAFTLIRVGTCGIQLPFNPLTFLIYSPLFILLQAVWSLFCPSNISAVLPPQGLCTPRSLYLECTCLAVLFAGQIPLLLPISVQSHLTPSRAPGRNILATPIPAPAQFPRALSIPALIFFLSGLSVVVYISLVYLVPVALERKLTGQFSNLFVVSFVPSTQVSAWHVVSI